MNLVETPTAVVCEGDTMLGVLAGPAGLPAPHDLAVVFVVGGPQYRVGSHRQFVQLAREMASAGYPTLRFDVRGMGDSEGSRRGFEDQSADIAAAVASVCASTGARRVVLWGLCDGASAALLYLHQQDDPRIAGLILANPWVRSEEGLAKTQLRHYYGRRLLSPNFWSELAKGRVTGQALRDLLRNLRLALLGSPAAKYDSDASQDFRERMAVAWLRFSGPILLILSENDYTAKEFIGHASEQRAWQGALSRSRVQRVDLPDSDHTFSTQAGRATVARICVNWLGSVALGREEVEHHP